MSIEFKEGEKITCRIRESDRENYGRVCVQKVRVAFDTSNVGGKLDTVVIDAHNHRFSVLLDREDENKTWARGWTGRTAQTVAQRIRAEAKEEEQIERAREKKRLAEDRARDEKHYAEATRRALRHIRFAHAVVKRAKLPRELRVAAFTALMTPPPPMMSLPMGPRLH